MRSEDTSTGKGEIAADLLAILCCPETKQEVCLLDQTVVERLNKRISKGELKTKGGQPVTEQIDGGLLRTDRTVAYPIRDQIPIMLIEEGILVEKSDLSSI
ncbi:Trm112 family protein [uncultured Nitrospira sp.]|uniref:Trm112 family protein n=1 Tax=uncultured Nitrospira sp. TaxID=157176 RepID=UPI0031400F40